MRGGGQELGRGGKETLQQDTDIIAIVAANVREARKSAGLSQEELALEAELDRTYISQVERGKRNVTVVVLARLARAMRTTVSALVSEGGESPAKPLGSVSQSLLHEAYCPVAVIGGSRVSTGRAYT
jgi:transcriptional regulator with XRE-family HTH domain